jgi:hypothetical protein
MKKKAFLFIITQILFSGWLMAQNSEPDLLEINEKRISMNSNGMLVLGGWAISNIAIGGIGMTQTSGNTRYFHQMNAAWNTVNLAIAGFGYYGLRNQSPDITLSETIFEFHNFEKILLFNAGLDIGYMAIGAYLWERGIRKDSNRLIGYGQSMILQGGFLFTFDVILYLLSRTESSALINSLDRIQFTGTQIAFAIPF